MKKLSKTLTLSRETLLSLDGRSLQRVAGAYSNPGGDTGCNCTWSDCSEQCFIDPYTRCIC